MRIGLLGAARITQSSIIEPAADAGVQVVAIAARGRDRAQRMADAAGIAHVHDGYLDLVRDPDVDVVYNALPNGLHGPWNLAALAAGKHVLCEKPFSATAAEARQVADAVRQSGRVLMVAFHNFYHPALQRVRELVGSGQLGTIRRIEVSMATRPRPADDLRWSFALAGGSLMDLGCYGLHFCQQLRESCGGPLAVTAAFAREASGSPGVDESMHVEVEFPNGAIGTVDCTMMAKATRMVARVTGDLGEVYVHDFVKPHRDGQLRVRIGDRTWIEDLAEKTSYFYQLQALAQAVRDGVAPPTDAAEGVAIAELIDECYRLARMPPRPVTGSTG
ncbi:Gfo/Idh/MocA family protein [Acuticoccus mangrovi]|uniref:Gfo/Idh/MocA family protein n=1 Tax=Acuticoccus mangrovi TaxID=2796142 RepID=UPI001B3BA8B0|nr:Gfo/Idh/MocA family oxidoreductase [Acuticoccus mangrovi]